MVGGTWTNARDLDQDPDHAIRQDGSDERSGSRSYLGDAHGSCGTEARATYNEDTTKLAHGSGDEDS